MEKAKEIAEKLGKPDFKGFRGWLDKWKKRYNVKQLGSLVMCKGKQWILGRKDSQRLFKGMRRMICGTWMKRAFFGVLYQIVDWAYRKAGNRNWKWKLEMETGNRKLKTEMEMQLLRCCINSKI